LNKKISFAASSLFFEQGRSEFPPKHGEGDRSKNRGQRIQVASAHHFPGRVLLKPEGKTSGKWYPGQLPTDGTFTNIISIKVKNLFSLQWVETNPPNILFSLRMSIFTSPHGTMQMDYGCPYTDVHGG